MLQGLNLKQLQNLSDKDWAGCHNYLSDVLVIIEKKNTVQSMYIGNSPVLSLYKNALILLETSWGVDHFHGRNLKQSLRKVPLSSCVWYVSLEAQWHIHYVHADTWKKSFNVSMRHTNLVTTLSH